MKPVYQSNPDTRFTEHADEFFRLAVAEYFTKSVKNLKQVEYKKTSPKDFLKLLAKRFGDENVSYDEWYYRTYHVSLPNMDFDMEEMTVNFYNYHDYVEWSHGHIIAKYQFDIETFSDTEDFVDKLYDLNSHIPQLIEVAAERRLTATKEQRKSEINKQTVRTLVANALKGSGCKYNLSFDVKKAVLSVTLDRKLYTKFEIPFDEIPQRIPRIVPVINQLNSIMREFDQPLRIKGQQSYDGWKDAE